MLALILAGALSLIPQPRSARSAPGDVAAGPVRVVSASAEDRFAAQQLGGEARRGPAILIGRAGEPAVEREIARRKLDRAALAQAEGYLLDAAPEGVLVAGADAAGVFYGVQTLGQLMRGGRVPRVTVADWPALRFRGLSVDISRGPVLTEEQMRALVRTLAEFKMNALSFYMEHVFPYRQSPLAAPAAAGITPELMRRLAEYARRYHVELVPQQQTFGHLHHLLKHELYADLGNARYGSTLAPEDERAYEWIRQTAEQLAGVFPSGYLHIGSDETFEIAGDAYMRHMRRVAEMLRPLNRKLMFWGDIALSQPARLPELPKDLVALSWTYDPRPDYTPWIEPFRRNGIPVMVCPGLNNWSRIFPNAGDAVANINGFVRDGKRLGAIGMLNTHWVDEGEGLFNMNWYGIVFSAAAAWQPESVDTAAFDEAFDGAFYRRSEPVAARVVGRFARVHRLLRATGVGDAADELFWLDPFSAPGARTVSKALPAAAEVRRLAEENLLDLAAFDAPRHGETIPFLRLAAKRLDWLGMKILFAQRMADQYRDALENRADKRRARLDLNRISSTNGMVEDLREGILELRGLYRTAWLAENRPYWLDNVLVRYDAEALYWQQKQRLITAVRQDFLETGNLPEPEKLGLVLPR